MLLYIEETVLLVVRNKFVGFKNNVFINCPFDQEYYPILKPILFTILYCNLTPIISETKDSDANRFEEIQRLIGTSKLSIHDLSRMQPAKSGDLPRFNMPLELGVDIGCKKFGSKLQKTKKYLILEKEAFRYKIALSDISGQDIKYHNSEPIKAVKSLRDWFKSIYPQRKIDLYTIIWYAYNEFHYDYLQTMKTDKIDVNKIWEIPFSEVVSYMKTWIKNSK